MVTIFSIEMDPASTSDDEGHEMRQLLANAIVTVPAGAELSLARRATTSARYSRRPQQRRFRLRVKQVA